MYTHSVCHSKLFFLSFWIAFLIAPLGAYAQEEGRFSSIHLDARTIERGYTFSLGTSVTVGVQPKSFLHAQDMTVRVMSQQEMDREQFVVPPTRSIRFPVLIVDMPRLSPASVKKPVTIAWKHKGIKDAEAYFYDRSSRSFKPLPTLRTREGISTLLSLPFAHVALLAPKPWEQNGEVDVSALPLEAAYVADGSEHVVFAKNAQTIRSIASITKLMTALVYLDHHTSWSKSVRIEARDDAEPAKVPFRVGDIVTTRDLFMAMLIGSKNNAAKALARSSGLSQKEFVGKMNAKAHSMGLSRTLFADTSGINPGNISSAHDIFLLAQASFKVPAIRDAMLKESYRIRTLNTKRAYHIRTTNPFLATSKDIQEGKTGYIDESGYNFVVHASRKNQSVIAVLFGAPSSAVRFQIAGLLIKYALKNPVLEQ